MNLICSIFTCWFKILKAFLLTFIFFICIKSYSQKSIYPYINYTTKDGLPSNEVYDVIQDKQGFIWFSTDNGLCKFNGYEFKTYGREKGLIDKVVFDLQLDSKGNIWMSTYGTGLFRYEHDSDSIYQLDLGMHKDKVKGLIIFTLDINADEVLFSSYLPHYYFKYFKNRLSIINSEKPVYVLNDNSLFSSYNLNENCVRVEYKNIKYPSSCDLETKGAFSYYYVRNDTLLLSYSKGNILFSPNKQIASSSKNYIKNIHYNKENFNYYASFLNKGGIAKYKSLNDVVLEKGRKIIDSINISSVLIDNKNIMWATSLESGLIKLNESYKANYSEINFMNNKEKLNNVETIDHTIFLLSNNGNLYKKKNSNTLERVKFKMAIKDIYSVNNELYLIDHLDQLVVYRKDKFEYLNISNKKILSKKVTRSKNQGEIISIAGHAVSSVDLKNNKVDKTLRISRTNFCLPYRNNNYIIGTKNGLFITDLIKSSPLYIDNSLEKLRWDFVTTLKDSTCIYASRFFDFVLDNKSKIEKFNLDLFVKDPNEALIGITSFNNQLLIYTSSRIILADIVETSISNVRFVKYDKLLVSQAIRKAFINEKEIHLYFENSVVSIPQNSPIFQKANAEKPIIEELKMNDLKIKIKANSNLIFNYDQNNFQIKLIALFYNHPNSINYAYKVNNGKEISLGNKRDLILLELSPGKYNLEFRAQNEDGIWSDYSQLEFTINEPFWNTKLAWVSYLTLAGFFTFYYFKRRENKIKNENAIKEEMTQLEKSALKAQMNPHFIFNSLNSIQKFILLNDKVEASEYLAKFAQLIRFNLKASNSQEVSLKNELDLLEIYAELEKLRFKEKFRIIIKNEIDVEKSTKIMIPPMLIQPILENSIVHGMSNVEQGLIVLEIKDNVDEYQLIVTITDNGKGVNNNISENHISMGSKITRRRLEIINKTKGTNYEIKNLISDEGLITGAEAKLIISYSIKLE